MYYVILKNSDDISAFFAGFLSIDNKHVLPSSVANRSSATFFGTKSSAEAVIQQIYNYKDRYCPDLDWQAEIVSANEAPKNFEEEED